MPDDAFCWCQSKKRFKDCHKNRDSQKKNPNKFKSATEFDKAFISVRYCSHPEASGITCGKIIRSHTVQKRGGLATIAENSHVYTTKMTSLALTKKAGEPDVVKVGINDASTFHGFCSNHDASLFLLIEKKQSSFSEAEAALFGFRAISYEKYTKIANMKVIEYHREGDKGLPFELQKIVQDDVWGHEQGSIIGLQRISDLHKKYSDIVANSDYSELHYYFIEFDRILPFVASGSFTIERDFAKRRLQRLGHGSHPLVNMEINVTSYGDRTLGVFSWLGDDEYGVARQFIESFDELPDSIKASALFQLCVAHLENTLIKISWWDETLHPADQMFLKSLMPPFQDPDRDVLACNSVYFDAAPVREKIRA